MRRTCENCQQIPKLGVNECDDPNGRRITTANVKQEGRRCVNYSTPWLSIYVVDLCSSRDERSEYSVIGAHRPTEWATPIKSLPCHMHRAQNPGLRWSTGRRGD